MKKENIIKVLIPVIAVIVVVESIVLVSNLNKGVAVVDNTVSEEVTPTEEVISQPVADFVFETENKEMVVGKSYTVNLNLLSKQDLNLDAMEVYIKYDPEKVTVSKLTPNKGLPIEDSGVNAKTGMVSSIFLWDLGEVYSTKMNDLSQLLSFTVTPKVVGETSISLLTGNSDQESVTMIVENPTSKSLNFSGNQLEINVSK